MDPVPKETATKESRGETHAATPPPLPPSLRTSRDRFILPEAPPVVTDSSAAAATIVVADDRSQSGQRRESAAWGGSVLIHVAILVLIALLVAPADLGGTAMQIIQLSFSDDEDLENEEPATVEFVSLETKATEPVEIDVITPQPTPNPKQVAANANAGGQNPGGTGGSGGARGSFFGIEASGQKFVYVLDQSGSMSGRRFRRASNELIRSIESLHEDQEFFVVLFSSHMTQMFNRNDLSPRHVRATRENKERLAEWLRSVPIQGGTDPRLALKLALQMNPSAVFMLSDGEFCDDTKSRVGILQQDGGNTVEMVQRMASEVPIHAIAYEDPASRENMEKLASMTGGDFRFIAEKSLSESELLKLAAKAQQLNTPRARASGLRELAEIVDFGQVSDAGKRKYAQALIDSANEALDGSRFSEAISLLESHQRVDPTGKLIKEQQDAAIDRIASRWDKTQNAKEILSAGQQLSLLPHSEMSVAMIERIVPNVLRVSNDHQVESFHVLHGLARSLGAHPLRDTCCEARDEIFRQLATGADRLRQRGELFGALDVYVKLRRQHSGLIQEAAYDAVLSISREILVQARKGAVIENIQSRDSIRDKLRQTLNDDELYVRLCTEFDGDEVRARKLLRQATRQQRIGDVASARRLLQRIMQDFPSTISAQKAQEQLSALTPTVEKTDEAALFNAMMGIDSPDGVTSND